MKYMRHIYNSPSLHEKFLKSPTMVQRRANLLRCSIPFLSKKIAIFKLRNLFLIYFESKFIVKHASIIKF